MAQWSGKVAELYNNVARHGSDGAKLLDPVLGQLLALICPGKDVFDGGCGNGRFMLDALELGALSVAGTDNCEKMVELARKALSDSGYSAASESVILGDVTALSEIESESFGAYLSINVGCNLIRLKEMYAEACRILKPNGYMLVTLPANLNLLFLRHGMDAEIVRKSCNQTLSETSDPFSIGTFGEVFRGTVVQKDRGYKLVEVGEGIPDGTPIWRKLAGIGGSTGLVVPNVWQSENAYLQAAEAAGFFPALEYHGKFSCQQHLEIWNSSVPAADRLGPLTASHDVFQIHVLRKPAK